jgi:hypothetical protein
MSDVARLVIGPPVRVAVMTWLLACVTCTQAAAPALVAIDVYGTSAFDSALIRSEFSEDLDTWREAAHTDDLAAVKAAKDRIVTSLRKRGDFALVDATMISYFWEPTVRYLTIDVVERSDSARRMPFIDLPRQRIADPDGAIELWLEYQRKAIGPIQSGNRSSAPCEVLHCLLRCRARRCSVHAVALQRCGSSAAGVGALDL